MHITALSSTTKASHFRVQVAATKKAPIPFYGMEKESHLISCSTSIFGTNVNMSQSTLSTKIVFKPPLMTVQGEALCMIII